MDYQSEHCLCQFNCGGGHRIWQVLLSGEDPDAVLPSSAQFVFIKKGKIMSVDAHLYNLDILSVSFRILIVFLDLWLLS